MNWDSSALMLAQPSEGVSRADARVDASQLQNRSYPSYWGPYLSLKALIPDRIFSAAI
jgi:hypothetical protein